MANTTRMTATSSSSSSSFDFIDLTAEDNVIDLIGDEDGLYHSESSLEQEEDEDPSDVELNVLMVDDLTPSSSRVGSGQDVDMTEIGGLLITVGMTLELKPEGASKHGKFLKISSIRKCASTISGIIFTGQTFQRSVSVAVPDRCINEVVLVEYYLEKQGEMTPALQINRVPASQLRLRDGSPIIRDLIITTDAFPSHNEAYTSQLTAKQELRDFGRLCCRLVITSTTIQASKRAIAGSIRFIREEEADVGFSHGIPSEKHVVLDHHKIRTQRRVTVASGCCGGSGDIRGFKMIPGVVVKFAWDFSKIACKTTKKNSPEIDVYCATQERALRIIKHYRIEILHISWPCQPYSPMKAGRATVHDESRTAALLATAAHVAKFKPLVFTMENTFGILHAKHVPYLHTVISDLVTLGYNVQWRCIQMMDYGLAASRKRVILIASHRDIPVPVFANATHGPLGSGLKPYNTVLSVAGNIPPHATQHLDTVKLFPLPKARYDPRVQAKCLLTGEGDQYHWSGARNFSHRERANLQEFPISHKFEGNKTEVNMQIGNAVPCQCWKVLMTPVVEMIQGLRW